MKKSSNILMILTMLILLMIMLISGTACNTTRPVIIYDLPVADLSSDMSIDRYLYQTTKWAIEMSAYVDELINQVMYRVPFVDMRK